MKIALIGASGSVGSRIAAEALARGHQVTAVARHTDRIKAQDHMTAHDGDIAQPEALGALLRGHDVVVSAVRFVDFDVQQVLQALALAGGPRLVMVGGAGSLLNNADIALVDAPGFPEAFKAEAQAGARTLAALRSRPDADWTFISPSALFAPGERTGRYRVGRDHLLVASDGKSHISQEDFAVALLDEVESPKHRRSRFTVGQ